MPDSQPESFPEITEPVIPDASAADGTVDAETENYEESAKAEDIKRLRAENKQRKQDRKERRKYAGRIFCLISIWLGMMGAIILLQGFSVLGFKLETTVLVTTVSTTTASVLGIFLIVANYLFPTSKK